VKASTIVHVTGTATLLVLSGLGSSILSIDKSHMAYAHTFSASESAQFLSLVEQIGAEAQLAVINLENNNMTLAQAHASKAAALLDDHTLDEIEERNAIIADTLEATLTQLEANVTSLVETTSQGPVPQDRIQELNQTVMTLDDIFGEATTVRVESEQRDNATTWATVLANITNVILSDYGNATGAPFDLTNMSNMEGMSDGQMSQSSNMTMDHGSMSMEENNDTMTTMSNASTMDNATTEIVDMAAYQSAQYLANNTISQLFNDTLKPLTANVNNNTSTQSAQNATSTNQTSTAPTSQDIDELENSLLKLKDSINARAGPEEVMSIVHTEIHPMLIEIYGLTPE
jgi:hypothetical protein